MVGGGSWVVAGMTMTRITRIMTMMTSMIMMIMIVTRTIVMIMIIMITMAVTSDANLLCLDLALFSFSMSHLEDDSTF